MICFNCGKQEGHICFPPVPTCTCESDKEVILVWALDNDRFLFREFATGVGAFIGHNVAARLLAELVEEGKIHIRDDLYYVDTSYYVEPPALFKM